MHNIDNLTVLPAEADETASDTPEGITLSVAGFSSRFFAFIIDCLLVGVLMLLVRLMLGGTPLSQPVLFCFSGLTLIRAAIFAAYFCVTTMFWGATFGKRLLRLKVVDQSGAPARKADILYRETVGRFLTSFLWIGYLVLAADRQHRGFHDMLCDTRVVYDI